MNYLMKDLPVGEQPDEKAKQFGISSLSDAELLSIVLRNGCNGKNVLETSIDILQKCNGLVGLCDSEDSRIKTIKGIGTVKFLQLQAVGEIARRIASYKSSERLTFLEPESIYNYYRNVLSNRKQEEVHVLLLDCKLHLLREFTVSKGTINSSLVSPADVFRLCLLNSAACFVLMHNHPSGDPSPSLDDINLTETIRDMGLKLQLPLIDHIILGADCYYSFKENSNILL